MSEQKKKPLVLWLLVIVFAIILVIVIYRGTTKTQLSDNLQPEPQHEQTSAETTKPIVKPKVSTKASLRDIIRAARTWGPAYEPWIGKAAPDFTLTDLAGKQHNLSDYRGKNVMLVFWATWCGPCVREVPHLIALRNLISEDELAILAISYNSPNNTTEMIKKFVKRNKRINYTVSSTDAYTMPNPYNTINSIPCSFFIDPDGKIKLATVGLLSLGSMKAIIQAE